MSLNFKEYQKHIGNSKFYIALGWFFLITGFFIFINNMLSFVSWNFKKINYTKEYVYSEFGTFYYESNNKNVYIQNIYNTKNEIITLDIPNNEIVEMYINKDNIHDGIYFDLDDTTDKSMLDPTMSILVSVYLVAMGSFFVLTRKEIKENKTTTSPLFLAIVFLLLIGSYLTVFEGLNAVNYFRLKAQNNMATATIFSQMYNKETEGIGYKPVAYYYVDGEKYLYVNNKYERGTIENRLGDTIELYYEKTNPSKALKTENPTNVKSLLAGISLALISSLYIIFKKRIDKRLQNNLLKQEESDWKI